MKHISNLIVMGALLLGSATAALSQTDGSATFRIGTKTYSGAYSPDHVLAIWVVDAQTNFVKTLKRQAATRIRYLYQWGSISKSNVVDGITGATLTSHQTHTVVWNCRNTNGVVVPDGLYRFFVEFTEDNAQGPWTATNIVSFYKGTFATTSYPPNQANFTNMMIAYVPVQSGGIALPAILQAEDYTSFYDTSAGNQGGQYRADNVDIEACAEGGYNVGWIVGGEWLGFNIEAPVTAAYQFRFRLASGDLTDKSLHVEVDGTNVTGGVTFNTGGAGWQVWTNAYASNVVLSAGSHALKVVLNSSNFNFNYLQITSAPANDVALTGLVLPSFITPGSTTNILVTATYLGSGAASFHVLLRDATENRSIGSNQVNDLMSGGTTNCAFAWNTAGATQGYHVLVASASAVAGELILGNNTNTATALIATGIETDTLIARGDAWRYNDTGVDLSGTPWRQFAYYDGFWNSGLAPLGYGNGNEATLLAPQTTYYFRRHCYLDFTPVSVLLTVQRDDGIVLYLNGGEIYRDNLASGPMTFNTPATNNVTGSAETNFLGIGLLPTAFLMGDNLLAAEIHQANANLPGASSIWINEIHYDNVGSDTNEGVEIAGSAGTDLAAYRLHFYDGPSGRNYMTNTLDGSLPNQSNGVGARWFAIPGIQNGGSDAVALVRSPTTVVQFLSYEGAMTAASGPAAGQVATDIGVAESSATPIGQSLQLTGTGSQYAAFRWAPPAVASTGILNSGQAISASEPPDIRFDLELKVVSPQLPHQHALAVRWVHPAESATLGDQVSVEVSVTNGGTVGETFRIVLVDTNSGQVVGSQVVETLSAGGMATVHFDWPTLNSTPGAHTLMAQIVVGDETNLAGSASSVTSLTSGGPQPSTAQALGSVGGWCTALDTDGSHLFVGAGATLDILDRTVPSLPVSIATLRLPGLIESIAVTGQYAFVACGPAGIHVVNISNPVAPSYAATLNTSGHCWDLKLKDNYLLAADGEAGLRIYDLSTPGSPVLVGAFATEGPARSVEIAGHVAYLLDSYLGPQILDITTPSAPSLLGRYTALNGGAGMALNGTALYVVDDNGYLTTLNVANPSNPSLAGRLLLNAMGKSITASGSALYVPAGGDGLLTLDATAALAPAVVATNRLPGQAMRVAAEGSVAYLTSGFAGLQVLDISVPLNPSAIRALPLGARASGVAVANGFAYIAAGESGLRVFSIANPAAPVWVGSSMVAGNARHLVLSGAHLFVSDSQYGLKVFSITNPAAPAYVGSYTHANFAGVRVTAVSGGLAALSDGRLIHLLDISTPAEPLLRGSLEASAFVHDLALAGSTLYAAEGEAGLEIVDVSNPAALNPLAVYDTPGTAVGIHIAGTDAFVADGAAGWIILDVSNPAIPMRKSGSSTPAGQVTLTGPYALTGDAAGLSVTDTANPILPVRKVSFDPLVRALKTAAYGPYALVAEDDAGLAIWDAVPNDRNLDRLPDDWQQSVVDFNSGDSVTNIADVLPDGDFDEDGFSNWQEYLAGTSATDPGSYFAVVALNPDPAQSGYGVQWYSVSNKVYTLWKSVNLLAGFSPVQTGIAATPNINIHTDPVFSDGAFYMVTTSD